MEKRREIEKKEVPLTALRDGEKGTITSIEVSYGRCLGFEKRLMDLGLIPGTEVIVVKSAPFKGPLEVSVKGSRFALGRGVARRIFVVKNNV
ncbi:MAG: FeoA family protein [Nitrososphaerales archaeon]